MGIGSGMQLKELHEEGYRYRRYPFTKKHARIIEIVKSYNCKKILDAGCGDGVLLEKLPPDSIGIDFVEEMVELCKKKGLNCIKFDLNSENLTSLDQKFDCIILADVIEHLLDPISTLKQCHSILDDSGVLILTTPNLGHWKLILDLILNRQPEQINLFEKPYHLRLFRYSGLEELLSASGFRVTRRVKPYLEQKIMPYRFVGGIFLVARKKIERREAYP
jgi:methionine biosynthesis protein MetW